MNKKFVAKIAATAMAFALAATSVVGDCSMASAAVRTVTVSTQKQLNRALKNNKVKSIVIKTDKPVKFTIGATSYAKKSLTVNAPEATVNNRGDFKKITVQDGKKFTDHGEGNQITISDPNSLKFVAGKNAEVASVTVTSKEGKILRIILFPLSFSLFFFSAEPFLSFLPPLPPGRKAASDCPP